LLLFVHKKKSLLTPLREIAVRLKAAGIEGALFEARMLIAAAPDPARLEAMVARRCGREPMALILGRQGFWTLDLEVSRNTLIPRADSETLIEAAVAALPDRAAVRGVLDLGTGTGCLVLAALVEFPQAFGVGVDVVPAAAMLAARNAVLNGLAARAMFTVGEWGASIAGRFDLVLCNPPYIEHEALAGLMPEVAEFEPASALDGGADGLSAYRAIIAELPGLLAPGGVAVLELGAGQAGAVAALAVAAGFAAPELRDDLAGIARAMVLRAGNC
jgi:release factor glutamine methyltransferase